MVCGRVRILTGKRARRKVRRRHLAEDAENGCAEDAEDGHGTQANGHGIRQDAEDGYGRGQRPTEDWDRQPGK